MNPVTAALILSYTGNIAQGWTLSGALDTISVSYRKSNTNAWLGTLSRATVIQSGVTSWLSGFSTHNIYGNLANYGNLVVSQTDSVVSIYGGQTCDWTGADDSNGNLQNKAGANILLHDVSALSAPTYDWYLNNFQNDGAIQWCGRGDTGGSTYQLYCRNNCVNTGLIVFEQVYGNLGTSAVWRNYALTPASSNPTQTITNNGGFLMRQMRVDFVQNYLGTGCWMVGNKAVMYMQDGVGAYQNYQYGSSLSGQSISFLDNTGVIHMDTQVYSHNSAFGARVYGFGAGNAIEFYETIKSFSYSSNILTVGFIGGNSVKINIGTGYSASGFSSAKRASTYGYFNSIYYSGSAPAVSRPSQCRMTAAVCTAKVPTTFSSTISCPADDSDSSSSTLATVVKVAQTATTSTTTSSIAKTTSTTSSTSAKTTSSSTNVVVKVATTAQMTSSTSTTQSTSSSSTKATKATTSAAVQATTTASTTTSAATAFPTFYLLSSCDGSCLGHFADDNQIFSNLYSADDNTVSENSQIPAANMVTSP